MQARKETILNVFPGVDDRHRLVIAISQVGEEPSTLVLRQETHSSDVGWFVQSCVAVEPGQVAGLKMALSSRDMRASAPPTRTIATARSASPDHGRCPAPAIVRFDRAVANQAG